MSNNLPVAIDKSATNHPYLSIEVETDSEGEIVYRLKVFAEDSLELTYDLRVANVMDRASLVLQLAMALAEDPTFGFGADGLPYRWKGNHWAIASKWFDSVGFSLYAIIRAAGVSSGSESFKSIARTAWAAYSKYDADGLNLKAFGRCPGIPFQDGVVIPTPYSRQTLLWSDSHAELPSADSEFWSEYQGDGSQHAMLAELQAAGFDVKTNPSPAKRVAPSWEILDHAPANMNLRVMPMDAGEALHAFMQIAGGNAESTLLMRFMRSAFQPGDLEIIQDWFGYHLVLGLAKNTEKMVYLWGGGGNGKSQVLELIRGLVGKDACAEVRLADLKIQANLEKLKGKLAMLGSEATPDSDLETLKMLVSREPVSCNPKYRDPFTIEPECLITQASNKEPAFREHSDAMSRRVVPIHMKHDFRTRDAGRIESIAAQIVADELSYLVGFALVGAMRCIQRDGFVPPKSSEEETQRVVAAGNPMEQFIDQLEFGPYELAEVELRNVYVEWCRHAGVRPVTDKEFKLELERLLTRNKVLYRSHSRIEGATYKACTWVKEKHVVPVHEKWGGGMPDRVYVYLGFRVASGWLNKPVGHPMPPSRKDAHLFGVVGAVPDAEDIPGEHGSSLIDDIGPGVLRFPWRRT